MLLRDGLDTRLVSLPAVVARQASDAPASLVTVIGRRRTTAAQLDVRSRRLAAVLRREPAGAIVDVVCCAEHLDDLLVGVVACRAAGLVPVPAAASSYLGGATGAVGALACGSGTARWKVTRGRGWLIGDGPFVPWWPVVERRSAPLGVNEVAADGVDEVRVRSSAPVRHQPGAPLDAALALAALAAGATQYVG